MTAETARHLADLEARFEAHASALRQHADRLREALAAGSQNLAVRVAPPADEPDDPRPTP